MSSAHSPTFPSLLLHHNSFSNPSVALPTSQLILQPFRCFTYVTAHSPTHLSLLLRHRLFTYVTWRAAHAPILRLSVLRLKRISVHQGKFSAFGRDGSLVKPYQANKAGIATIRTSVRAFLPWQQRMCAGAHSPEATRLSSLL